MFYTGNSQLEAPLFFCGIETVPYQLSFNNIYWTVIYAFKLPAGISPLSVEEPPVLWYLQGLITDGISVSLYICKFQLNMVLCYKCSGLPKCLCYMRPDPFL